MAKSFDEMSPDELQKLSSDFGSLLQSEKSGSVIPSTAEEAAGVFQGMPRTAAESAETFEGLPQPSAQDIVDSQSIPGKSAAQSAQVFEGMPKTAAESAQTLEGVNDADALRSGQQESYNKLFGKQTAQDLVDTQSVPGKSAADSAKVFGSPSADEIVNSQSIPGKTAADSARVFEEAGHSALPVGKSAAESAEVLANAPELKDPVLKQLASKFPTKQAFADFLAKAKGMLPETGEEAMYALGKGVGAAGRIASKVAGPASLAYEALKSTPAGATDLDYSPSTMALMKQNKDGNGSSSTPASTSSSGGDQGPSLFQMGSDAYKAHAKELTSPAPSRSPGAISSSGSAPEAQPSAPQLQAPTGPSPLDRLRAAHRQADLTTAMNQLGQAGAQIGSGIPAAFGGGVVAPTQVNDKIFDTNIALAQKLPERVGEELKMERMDPKSETSVSARNFIKTNLGVNVPDNISADQLKEQFPVIEKYLQAKENARVRIETAKQHNELMQAMRGQALEDKHNTQDNHDFAKLGEKLTAGLASSRNTLGRTDNTIRAATALEGLKARIKDPNNMTTQEIAELATGVNSMLTQGMGSDHGVKMILPTSAQGDLSKVQAYISNIPQGAQQGAFVQRLFNTIETEKNIAKQLQGQIKTQAVAGYTHLKDRNPTRWNELMSAHGLGADEPGMSSGPSPQTQVPQQDTSQAPTGQSVKVKSLKTGTIKTLDAATAQKYLSHPNDFQQVQ